MITVTLVDQHHQNPIKVRVSHEAQAIVYEGGVYLVGGPSNTWVRVHSEVFVNGLSRIVSEQEAREITHGEFKA